MMTRARVIQDTTLLSFMQLNDIGAIGERQLLIYDMLSQLGQATDWEITKALGKNDPNFVRPRRKELYDKGLIRAVAKRECSITHKHVLVWEVVKREW